MYINCGKPIIDLLVSCIVLLVTLPITLTVGIMLALVNEGKPFFVQARPGKNGDIFHIIKFKTMNDKRSADGALLPDAHRLTPIGKFVRKTSIDEIPQLINVLKGDMSLIGPRPLLVQYLELYNEEQKKRHNLRPGITGWAQVNGRNTISWKKKFEYDVWYVNNASFALDLSIIVKTIVKVFKAADINSNNSATAEFFNGNN